MNTTLFDVISPAYRQILGSLSKIMGKAIEFQQSQGWDGDKLPGASLHPDMFDLTRQIQIASDTACRSLARLASRELPSFEDNESTLEDLSERLTNAVAYLDDFTAADLADAGSLTIDVPIGGGNTMPMDAHSYVVNFALPNFYFHATTAYDILRANGLDIGKRDFLGG